jgi:hypothetical protein
VAIDDVEIVERPEPEAVSREEANGMWTQLDAVRIATQSHTGDLAAIKTLCAGLVSDARWHRGLLFLLLLERVGAHVFATAPAKAVLAMVSP